MYSKGNKGILNCKIRTRCCWCKKDICWCECIFKVLSNSHTKCAGKDQKASTDFDYVIWALQLQIEVPDEALCLTCLWYKYILLVIAKVKCHRLKRYWHLFFDVRQKVAIFERSYWISVTLFSLSCYCLKGWVRLLPYALQPENFIRQPNETEILTNKHLQNACISKSLNIFNRMSCSTFVFLLHLLH